jgi:hypothetical protein
MNKNTMRFAILLLAAGFTLPAALSAGNTVEEQDKPKRTQAKLQVQDQDREQDRSQTREKLQTKEQLRLESGGNREKTIEGEKNTVKERERTRVGEGADNAKGQSLRETTENAGGENNLKNQEKNGGQENGKELKKQERKREKKSVKEQRSSDKAERRATRSENRKMNGKLK